MRPPSSTRRRSVRLSPIAEDPYLLPPVGVWAVPSPNVAVHPLRPATRRRHGGPLPRRQADGTQTRPLAGPPRGRPFPGRRLPSRRLMRYYPRFRTAIPRQGVDCPRVTHPSAALGASLRLPARLACLRRAASVRSEPGSNSPSLQTRKPKFPEFQSFQIRPRPRFELQPADLFNQPFSLVQIRN